MSPQTNQTLQGTLTTPSLHEEHLKYAMVFLFSTAIMALTLNIVIVSLWVLFWVLSRHYSTNTKGMGFLIFYICLYLFYPTSATAFHLIHWRHIVFSGVLFMFITLYRPSISKYLKGHYVVKMTFYGWIIWGLFAYSHIFYVNYIHDIIFNVPYAENPSNLITLTRDSTMFTVVIPMLSAPLMMLIPLFALRNIKDFKSFWVILTKLTFVLLILSLIRYVFFIEFIPQNYVGIRQDGFRLGALSVVNAGDFSRLLLLPLLFISSLAIRYPSKVKLYGWVTLLLTILCIMLTYSRITYISSLAALIFLLLLNLRKTKFSMKIKAVIFTVVIIFFIIAAFYQMNIDEKFLPGSQRTSMGSLQSRLLMYEAAFIIISDNPLFGAFPGGHELSKSKLGIEGLIYGSAHNMLLNVAVEWGLPMAILLLLVLFLALWNGIQAIKKTHNNQNIKNLFYVQSIAYGTVAVTFAYMLEGLTNNIPPMFVFFILGLVLASKRIILNVKKSPPL